MVITKGLGVLRRREQKEVIEILWILVGTLQSLVRAQSFYTSKTVDRKIDWTSSSYRIALEQVQCARVNGTCVYTLGLFTDGRATLFQVVGGGGRLTSL